MLDFSNTKCTPEDHRAMAEECYAEEKRALADGLELAPLEWRLQGDRHMRAALNAEAE